MKKILSMLMVLFVGLSAFGCTSEQEKVVTLKVWGDTDERAFHEWALPLFQEANPDSKYEIEFEVVGEDKVRETFIQDPDSAADVFMFPNDQIEDLMDVDALLKVPTAYHANIIANNNAGSVQASRSGGELYAFPATADNGYFLYYDKSYFTAEEVKSLDTMVTKMSADSKQVLIDFNQGWYSAGFLFMAGALTYNTDGTVSYAPESNDKLNALGESLVSLINSPTVLVASEDTSPSEFQKGTLKACVTGSWRADAIKGVLGDNYAATKLPTLKLGTVDTQISSFAGYKLVGVNQYSSVPNDALKYAEFITNEASQLKRFELRGTGPSNINASSNEAVLADVALAALALQNQYATPQGALPNDSFWTPVTGFGAGIKSGEITALNVVEKIQELVKRINREE